MLSRIDLEEVGRVGNMWDGRTVGRPGDCQSAIDAVAECYGLAGLEQPRRIVWCEGPTDLSERLVHEASNGEAGFGLRASIVDDAREAVSAQVQKRIDAVDRSRIQSRLGLVGSEALRRSIATEFSTGVRRKVAAFNAKKLGWRRLLPWMRLAGAPRDLGETGVSRYSSSWLAIYQVLGEACGLGPETERLGALWRAVLASSWIVPYQNVCWITSLPSTVKVDRNNRLHCATGPALSFPDGWNIYAWKGVPLPPEIIEDRAAIDGDAIARQPDPVLRRCMLEIMTPERFIREGEATCVATDETGRLWRRRWPNGDVWAAVEVLNGTPEPDGSVKHYFLQVPPGVRTAREAVAWTYGLTELRYMALKQRT
jgi:hypothetical protein